MREVSFDKHMMGARGKLFNVGVREKNTDSASSRKYVAIPRCGDPR